VRTLAGSGVSAYADGVGTFAAFRNPLSLAYSSARDELYVCDFGDHRIRVYFPYNRSVTTLAGTGVAGPANGAGAVAAFNTPVAAALDGAALYIADQANNMIRLVNVATRSVSTFAGSGTAGFLNGPASSARFNAPTGVATNGTHVFVAEANNFFIRAIQLATLSVYNAAFNGTRGWADGGPPTSMCAAVKQLSWDGGTKLYFGDANFFRAARS